MSKQRFLLLTGLGSLGALALLFASPDRAPRLVFNATASAPLGFYWVTPGRFEVGDLVAASPPPPLARWMAARHYLPINVPLLKVVVATGGHHVCGRSAALFLDGKPIVPVSRLDRWRRPLPSFSGCRRLRADEVLLVNADAPNSLDSRYFGPLTRDRIVGRATPLWTWEARP